MKEDFITFTKDKDVIEKWIAEIDISFLIELFGDFLINEKIEIGKIRTNNEISINDVIISSTKRVIDTIFYFFKNRDFLKLESNLIISMAVLFCHMNSCAIFESGHCWISPILNPEIGEKLYWPTNTYERYIYNFCMLSRELNDKPLGYSTLPDFRNKFILKKNKDNGNFYLLDNDIMLHKEEYRIVGKDEIKIDNLVNHLPPHKISKLKNNPHETTYTIKLEENKKGEFLLLEKVNFLKMIIKSYDEHYWNQKSRNKTKKSARR